MFNASRIEALLRSRKAGHTLPQPFYNDPEIFEADLAAVFYRNWLMVGFEVELKESGAYIALTIGKSPILVVRQKNGEIAGFHNSCRHRGAQICRDGSGRAPRLVCPYHQWAYGLDGKLLVASRMGDDFDPAQYGLRPIHVELISGCIYICLGEDAPDIAPFRAALEPMLAPHNLSRSKIAHTSTIVDTANWKLVMENGRECHHCAARHPELKVPFPIASADSRDLASTALQVEFEARMSEIGLPVGPNDGPWWQIGRFPLNRGAVSFSLDGRPLVSRPMVTLNDGDVGTLRWAIEPNNFCHAAGDNVLMFMALPVGPQETHVTAKWLVHEDAVEGVDYDLDRLTHVWTQTNLQDRDLAENNQRGVNSVAYIPGPYSPEAEEYVDRFITWYCATLEAELRAE